MSDDIEHVIIVYQRKKDNPSEKGNYLGCIESNDMTMETCNFLIDSYKAWLWSAIRADAENGS